MIKLRDFMKNLNKMIEADPTLLDLEVVTAVDDEGNGYKRVVYDPSIGKMDKVLRHGSRSPYGTEYWTCLKKAARLISRASERHGWNVPLCCAVGQTT